MYPLKSSHITWDPKIAPLFFPMFENRPRLQLEMVSAFTIRTPWPTGVMSWKQPAAAGLRIGLRVVRTSPTKRNWEEVMLNSLDTSAIHGNFQKLPYPNHPQHKHPQTAQHAKITWSFGILHSQPKRRSCTCRRPGSFTDREIHCKMCTSKMFTILQSCKMIKKNWKRVVFLGDCIQKHCTPPINT